MTAGPAALKIPAFSQAMASRVCAQVLDVVDADRCDAGSQRLQHVGRVEPAANPTSTTATSTRASAKSSNAIAVVASKNVASQSLDQIRAPRDPIDDRSSATGAAVDQKALAKVDQMRRRVYGHAETRDPEQRVERRAHTALAIRTADMEGLEGVLGGRSPRGAPPCARAQPPFAGNAGEEIIERVSILPRGPARRGVAVETERRYSVRGRTRSGRRPPRQRRFAAHVPEQLADGLLELPPVDDVVEHAVLEQEFRGLESLRQILANGLLDHPRPREADDGPGSARIASPSMA